MHFFLRYLFKSPLIRMTTFWFVISLIGIGLFSWKLTGMRQDLLDRNAQIQSTIRAVHLIEKQAEQKNQEELDTILEKIEKYRPSVPELLGFIETVEAIAANRNLDLELFTINTGDKKAAEEGLVSYKLTLESSLSDVKGFIRDFEKSHYAIRIENIDMKKTESESFQLTLIFILYTQLS